MKRLFPLRLATSLLFAFSLLTFSVALAQTDAETVTGLFVEVSPDLTIYYEEAGTGDPIVFIPGWTGSTYYMRQQVEHFSQAYHAISFDPRSQGRSSKTLENNTYTQHGEDLRAFIEALELENVVLVGHSWGCLDAYAYFRAYGTDNIRAFVCIDSTPKPMASEEGDFGDPLSYESLAGKYRGMAYDRLEFTRGFVNAFLFVEPLPEDEVNRVVDAMLRTPTYAMINLDYDAQTSDYTPEARGIDGEIPVLYVLADNEGWTEMGQAWLAENTPNTEVVVVEGSNHNVHVEFADEFNAAVEAFLTGSE